MHRHTTGTSLRMTRLITHSFTTGHGVRHTCSLPVTGRELTHFCRRPEPPSGLSGYTGGSVTPSRTRENLSLYSRTQSTVISISSRSLCASLELTALPKNIGYIKAPELRGHPERFHTVVASWNDRVCGRFLGAGLSAREVCEDYLYTVQQQSSTLYFPEEP